MASRLILLGTGTCQLDPARSASSILIELLALRIVFDMGRGTATRLAQLGLRQDEIEHIVISHFHPDHISDLIPFLQAAYSSRTDPRKKDLSLYGPVGLQEVVRKVLGFFDLDEEKIKKFQIHVHEISSESHKIGGHFFNFVSLPPAGNQGFGFDYQGKKYRLTGDSYFHQQEIDFLKEVDLAVFDSGHLEMEEIIRLAVETQAKKLVCSHLYAPIDLAALNEKAHKAGYRGEFLLGHDLMEIQI